MKHLCAGGDTAQEVVTRGVGPCRVDIVIVKDLQEGVILKKESLVGKCAHGLVAVLHGLVGKQVVPYPVVVFR